MKRSADHEKIAHLIPLRVSGDVSVDEAKQVDEAARYDASSRAALDEYTQIVSMLQDSASWTGPEESPVVRGEASLWGRIEPQLGPVASGRRTPFGSIPTRYLTIAAALMVCLTVAHEGRRSWLGAPPVDLATSVPVTTAPQVAAPSPSQTIRVTSEKAETILVSELGMTITRLGFLLQRGLGLEDMDGVVITRVLPGSIAESVGLHAGDCLIKVDGDKVYAPRHALELFQKHFGDRSATFEVIRDRSAIKLDVEYTLPDDADHSQHPPSTPRVLPIVPAETATSPAALSA